MKRAKKPGRRRRRTKKKATVEVEGEALAEENDQSGVAEEITEEREVQAFSVPEEATEDRRPVPEAEVSLQPSQQAVQETAPEHLPGPPLQAVQEGRREEAVPEELEASTKDLPDQSELPLTLPDAEREVATAATPEAYADAGNTAEVPEESGPTAEPAAKDNAKEKRSARKSSLQNYLPFL